MKNQKFEFKYEVTASIEEIRNIYDKFCGVNCTNPNSWEAGVDDIILKSLTFYENCKVGGARVQLVRGRKSYKILLKYAGLSILVPYNYEFGHILYTISGNKVMYSKKLIQALTDLIPYDKFQKLKSDINNTVLSADLRSTPRIERLIASSNDKKKIKTLLTIKELIRDQVKSGMITRDDFMSAYDILVVEGVTQS